MYHAWKSKNKKRNAETEQRAPKSVTDYGEEREFHIYINFDESIPEKTFLEQILLLC